MLLLLKLVAVTSVAVLLPQPLAMRAQLRLQGRRSKRRSTVLVGAYFAVTGFTLALFITEQFRDFGRRVLDFLLTAVGERALYVLVAAAYALMVLTPLVTWLQRRWSLSAPGYCACGYDLRGNTSGTCPECGLPLRPAGDAELFRNPDASRRLWWFRPWVVWLASASFVLATAYEEHYIGYYCTECARFGSQTDIYAGAPLFDRTWQIRAGAIRARENWPDQLVRWLDPEGNCPHRWKWHYEGSASIFGRGVSYGGAYKLYSLQTWERDFGLFMQAHPEVHERIRECLRKREPFGDWLDPLVVEWRGAEFAPDADSSGLP